MDVISVSHLTRDFGENRGIFDLSFTISQGETFGFLGPNGAGKTTLIRHLMGFLRSKSGSCRISGIDCWSAREKTQRQIGYLPGEISFFEGMNGAAFLHFLEDYRGVKSEKRKLELLERFELDPKIKIREMSKGTKQKLAIVAALMHDPQVLILDEPTTGLDPLMQNRFVDLLRQEKDRGKTIFLSSHLFEEVEKTCDRVGIIRRGVLVATDAIDGLRKRHLRSYTVDLKNEESAKAFAHDFNGIRCGQLVTVCSKPSLEEIFLNYYGGDQYDK